MGCCCGLLCRTISLCSSFRRMFCSIPRVCPTLTIQALAYMSADAIENRYRKNPGPLL
jgi:hypothetical protein